MNDVEVKNYDVEVKNYIQPETEELKVKEEIITSFEGDYEQGYQEDLTNPKSGQDDSMFESIFVKEESIPSPDCESPKKDEIDVLPNFSVHLLPYLMGNVAPDEITSMRGQIITELIIHLDTNDLLLDNKSEQRSWKYRDLGRKLLCKYPNIIREKSKAKRKSKSELNLLLSRLADQRRKRHSKFYETSHTNNYCETTLPLEKVPEKEYQEQTVDASDLTDDESNQSTASESARFPIIKETPPNKSVNNNKSSNPFFKSSTPTTQESKKCPVKSVDAEEIVKNKIIVDNVATHRPRDELTVFGEHLVNELRSLSERKYGLILAETKHRINTVLYDAEIKRIRMDNFTSNQST